MLKQKKSPDAGQKESLKMYIVKSLSGKSVLAYTNTERKAILAGRRNQREIGKISCAYGFRVYDDHDQVVRIQICDNFGNNWHEKK